MVKRRLVTTSFFRNVSFAKGEIQAAVRRGSGAKRDVFSVLRKRKHFSELPKGEPKWRLAARNCSKVSLFSCSKRSFLLFLFPEARLVFKACFRTLLRKVFRNVSEKRLLRNVSFENVLEVMACLRIEGPGGAYPGVPCVHPPCTPAGTVHGLVRCLTPRVCALLGR